MKRLLLIGCGFLFLIAGCAYVGAIGAGVLLTQEEDEDAPNLPPAAGSASAVAVAPTWYVTLHFALHDAESDPAHVFIEHSTDGGSTFSACSELAGSESEGTNSLQAIPQWAPHVFVWDATADLTGYNVPVTLRVTPQDSRTGLMGTAHVYPVFTWRINAGPSVSVLDPGPTTGRVAVYYTLADPESDPANVVVEYSTDGGLNYNPASEAAGGESEGSSNLLTTPTGVTHEFVWNSFPNVGGVDVAVIVRVTPFDCVSQVTGTQGVSPAFSVWNSRVVTVAGVGTLALGNVAASAADANGVLYFSELYGHRIVAFNTGNTRATAAGFVLNPGQVRWIAGTGLPGYNGDHIPARNARLNDPLGLAADNASPPNLYVADTSNHRVRKIDGATGYISTLTGTGSAGSTDNVPAPLGELNGPQAVACDLYGNVFIADTGNHMIRAVNLGNTVLAVGGAVVPPGYVFATCGADHGLNPPAPPGGDGILAFNTRLESPAGIAFDGAGHLLISDSGHYRIRAVNTSNPAGGPNPVTFGNITITAGNIDTIAGSGAPGFGGDGGLAVAGAVLLDSPGDLVMMSNGALLFTDRANHAIRAVHTGPSTAQPISVGSVTLLGGNIDTVAGQGLVRGSTGDGGTATSASLDTPSGLALAGGAVVIADSGNRRLRAMNPAPSSSPSSVTLGSLTFDPAKIGALYASPGFPIAAPAALAPWSNTLFLADAGGHRILALDMVSETVIPVAGTGSAGSGGDGGPSLSAGFSSPAGLVVDSGSGKLVLIADTGNNRVRAVHFDTATGGSVTAFGVTVNAGEVESLPSTIGQLTSPTGLAIGPNGDLFIADTGGNRIVRVARSGGALIPVSGTGAAGHQDDPPGPAQFNAPEGIAVSASGALFVADTGNHAVRVINLGGVAITYGTAPSQVTIQPGDVGTIGGTAPWTGGWDGDGREAWLSLLNSPVGILVDGFGAVTFSERGNHRIRRIAAGSGSLCTLAGGGTAGFNGDGNPLQSTLFNSPEGISIDSNSNLYLADRVNGRVRRFRAP